MSWFLIRTVVNTSKKLETKPKLDSKLFILTQQFTYKNSRMKPNVSNTVKTTAADSTI